MVESQPSKLLVASSILVSRSKNRLIGRFVCLGLSAVRMPAYPS